MFCPNCNNVLDISKTTLKNSKMSAPIIAETPSTVSDVDETESDKKIEKDNISDIIHNILNEIMVDEKIIQIYNMDEFLKHSEYLKLDKKQKSIIQNKLSMYFGKIDDSINAYYVCSNCTYSKAIDSGSIIMSKTGVGNSIESYINYDKLKNKIYNKVLPITKNFICINDKCESHKDPKKREAVFYRIGKSLQAWYTCKSCQKYWKGE
jgi:hypothetical protein